MTQPALGGSGTDPVSGISLEQLLTSQITQTRILNEKLVEMGKKKNFTVIDLATAMPKTSAHFYDLWHYTNKGSAAVADIAYKQLCPFLSKRFPDFVVEACPAEQ